MIKSVLINHFKSTIIEKYIAVLNKSQIVDIDIANVL